MELDAITAEVPAEAESAHTSSRKSARNARIELITRGERRRRWTIEQKQTIAAQSLAPGASSTEVARFDLPRTGVERSNPESLAQFSHANSGPGLTVRRLAAHPIHRRCDLPIRPMPAELLDGLHGVRMAVDGISTGPAARDTQLGVAAAVPMDHHDRLVRHLIAVEDHLPDQDVRDPLLRASVRSAGIPCRR
jgi:hypothetical protein